MKTDIEVAKLRQERLFTTGFTMIFAAILHIFIIDVAVNFVLIVGAIGCFFASMFITARLSDKVISKSNAAMAESNKLLRESLELQNKIPKG